MVRIASIGIAMAAAIIGFSTHIALTMPVLAVAGATWVVALSTFNVSVQLSTPRWVLARALSVYQTATFGGMAAGSWLLGVLADNKGVTAGLLAAGAVTLLNAAVGLRVPLSQTGHLNLDPLRSWQEPDTAVPVDSRTGPVVITIEYRIREEDIVEFLNIMSERRRIRRRDGARNWTLLRDLADPEVWIERYKTPTWLDYIRHNSRMTQDDATVFKRLRALHSGPGTPTIRRLIERETGSLPSGQSAAASITDEFTGPT
jgi:hypothetical protein